MSEFLISFALFTALLAGWRAYRRFKPKKSNSHRRLDELANAKSERITQLHSYLRTARRIAGVMLILGFSMFIVGGVSEQFTLAVIGWLIWVSVAFIPAIVDGIDALLLDAAVSRSLILGRGGKIVYGEDARAIGVRRIVGGAALLVVALLASVLFLIG